MKATIIAAIITGIFTIVAGLATYWVTQKEPALTYSISESPVLPGSGVTKQIYVILVTNTGKKDVAGTLAQIQLKEGEIKETASEASPGMKLSEDQGPKIFKVTADTMNPGEYVKLSLLLASQSGKLEPKVVVRAPGVNASLLEKTKKPIEQLPILVAALAATISVLMGASPLVRRLFLIISMAPKSPGNSLEQNEIVSYICAKAGLTEEADKLRFSSAELSYRGAADYLMFRALEAEPNMRERYAVALKAMLLNDDMATESAISIRRAIGVLTANTPSDEEFEAIRKDAVREGDNPDKLRDKVDMLLQGEIDGTAISNR